MKRLLLGSLALGVLIIAASLPGAAQEETQNERSAQPIFISTVPLRGLGIAVTFPLPSLPAPSSTATIFVDTFFQGEISPSLIHKLDVRFFFHFLSGFRFDLTSVRESIMVVFSSAPVIFSLGGGLGVLPLQGVPVGTSDGFLLAFHARANLEVQVSSLGLFLDVTYETLPQPFADITAAGSLVASVIGISVGAIIHF